MASEPKDRLREARLTLGLTRAQLAAKIGRAESTVRAHENGQNKIQPEMATLYARELGLSPSWILYGHGDLPHAQPGAIRSALALRTIPVVGEIWPGADAFVRVGEETRSLGVLMISLPEYEDRDLSAYSVRGMDDEQFSRRYVIAAKSDEPLSLVDTVILRVSEGNFYYLDLWRVGAEKDWVVFYQGESQARASEIIKVRDLEDNSVQVAGVVVAEMSIKRRIEYAPLKGQDSVMLDFNTALPQQRDDA